MSRKDYQALAGAIREARLETSDCGIENHRTMAPLVWRIVDVLAADNPRFDRQRFLTACETGKVSK